jgi:DNA-binding NarL/FixJ family response regulator
MLHITPAERTMLQLLANGRANYEVARVLRVDEHEIEARLAALFVRMGAATRTEAIAAALRRGLVIAIDANA